MTSTVEGNTTRRKLVQYRNVDCRIVRTGPLIVIFSNPLWQKAAMPISRTDGGMSIDLNDMQVSNVQEPITSTELGNVMEGRLIQS